jgi:hypothetical protein
MAGRGYNTFHGFDTGPPPPGFPPAQPGGQHPTPQFRRPGWPQQPFGFPAFQQPAVLASPLIVPPAVMPGFPYPFPYPYGGQAHPAIAPVTDGGFPGIHLRNDTGGIGLPPGYDYAFPHEHTKIHVFTTKEKPWQNQMPLWNWDATKHVKLLVPSTTTVKGLMQNLGCTNEDAKKNVLYEVSEQGNGKWVKGLTITVSDIMMERGWERDDVLTDY